MDLPVAEAREQILAIHLRKRGREPKRFDLKKLAAACEGFSGAEIEQAVMAGLHAAYTASAELTGEHLEQAFAGSPPIAVTMAERIERLRAWAKGRCVPAD